MKLFLLRLTTSLKVGAIMNKGVDTVTCKYFIKDGFFPKEIITEKIPVEWEEILCLYKSTESHREDWELASIQIATIRNMWDTQK